MKFDGKWVGLPWQKFRNVQVSPEGIRTFGGRVIDPQVLDLLVWKAAFYDRGKAWRLEDPPEWLQPSHAEPSQESDSPRQVRSVRG